MTRVATISVICSSDSHLGIRIDDPRINVPIPNHDIFGSEFLVPKSSI